MTTLPSYQARAMEFASLDDKMDVASSPYPQLEEIQDLDFEFDQMDNQYLEPKSDNMMDDATEPGDAHENAASVEDLEYFEEPDMNDDEEGKPNDVEPENEFQMKEAAQHDREEQEEVLYDDEEEESTVITNEAQIEDLKTNTQPVHEIKQLLEPDDILAATLDEAQQHIANHETGPQEAIDQLEIEAVEPLAGEEQFPDNEQTLRDDGDGPIVDPVVTEYHDDPDARQLGESADAQGELLLEETFEDDLKAEPYVGTTQTDENTFEPAPAIIEAAQQPHIEESLEAAADASDLHAVRLVYLGDEYSLFPPKEEDSTSFFLSDPSLAFEPLAKLLESCGQILEGSIGHDDELVLDVPTMGLHICQDSKYASELSLHQIVEVYLTLNRNEVKADIAPLYCNLSSRICLGTQYKYLIEQAQKGTSFTDIVDEHADSPELEDVEAAPEPEPDQEAALEASALRDAEGADNVQADVEIVDAEVSQPIEADLADTLVDASEEVNIEEEQYFLEDFAAHDDAVEEAIAAAPVNDQPKSNTSRTAEDAEPAVDTEVSEYFDEALDEAAEQEDEELQEEKEDQSVLQAAVAGETDDTQTLLDEEAAHDAAAVDEEGFDADEFLINDDDDDTEETVQAETEAEASVVNGKHEAVNGSDAPAAPPVTPSKKASKRKVNEDDDDLLLEMDTPEPKRRRPS